MWIKKSLPTLRLDDPCNYTPQRSIAPVERTGPRIVILRAGSSGDIVMTTPMLAALRGRYPEAYISWMVEPKFADVLAANPHLDELILWGSGHWKRCMKREKLPPWSWELGALKQEVADRRPDIFISFHGEQFEWLVRHCGAETRIGFFDEFPQFDDDESGIRAKGLYTKIIAREDQKPHRTDTALLALTALGLSADVDKQMYLGFTEADLGRARKLLADGGHTAGKAYAVIAPLTTWVTRNWELDRFCKVCDRLASESGLGIVLIGSQDQTEAIEKLRSMMRAQAVISPGTLTLRQTAALISESAFVLSGDTGPMHFASAVGVPYVALFGSTPAEGRAPLAGRGIIVDKHVDCAPCDHKICRNPVADQIKCMKAIGVDEVYEACVRQIHTA